MIKTNKGKVKLKGNTGELLADLAIIIHALYFEILLTDMPEEKAKEMVLDMCNTAFLTEDQIAAQNVAKIVNDLTELMNIIKPEESEGEAE